MPQAPSFKMVTGGGGTESGIITPSSIIQDRGIYTYYKDPAAMCWIYSQTGSTHGRINVSRHHRLPQLLFL